MRYTQFRRALCQLLRHNLLNTLDFLEYYDKGVSVHSAQVFQHVEKLYRQRFAHRFNRFKLKLKG